MSKTAARLTRAEQATHQRTLEELKKRRGVLRWICYASDAEPNKDHPGFWESETFDLFISLPSSLAQQGMDAIGYEWDIKPDPDHDEA